MKKNETNHTAQGVGAAEKIKGSSLSIAESIKMPNNYRKDDAIHILGLTEDGSEDEIPPKKSLLFQLAKNVFLASVGMEIKVCMLFSDEGAERFLNDMVEGETYELAALLRDHKNVFIYVYTLNDLVEFYGEDIDYLNGKSFEHLLLGNITEKRVINEKQLWEHLKGEALEKAHSGDCAYLKSLIENLKINNALAHDILAYLIFLYGLAEESNGDKDEAEEIYAMAIKYDPSIEKVIKDHRLKVYPSKN